ncbi:DRTGG domain-containing protein [Pullulanibacillus sp. KACC 23026]|uniref:DRTGG domain-containing protein n=1 Tax=Pullulanibacillus sp. KACC 23026 TaxID=3028315 RepID=UPI0023B0D3BC|nr:DRTGG domain-containing protein [Pullulanibacillus sp. KACC 23026]WEG13893.1 DRTGG domain-containing protein [Pullulanibacillus sp. KACC 23026]
MVTKHEQLLEYIKGLEIGHKISVRQVARALSVSEGTAYRAIKDAENQGFVSTIERVGTIRIEKKHKGNIERLTYAEVVNIVDGQVLGGKEGLHKTLNRFVIGAMKLEAMMRYIDAGGLLIVGNRDQAHEKALQAGAAVLITGGFDTREDVKRLADSLQLPVISTSYDTFTVAAMINRAIYDQLIKKEILLVSDILIPLEKTSALLLNDKVEEWHRQNERTGHSRYPVMDSSQRLCGIVTSKDIIGRPRDLTIEKVMTKDPITVSQTTSVASAAHRMIWEGIECLPVMGQNRKLMGIITRQDVLKALQMSQRQPQVGETIDDLVDDQLSEMEGEEGQFRFDVSPQMTNHLGMLSNGVMTTAVTTVARRYFHRYKKGDLVIETITFYYLKPVQLESTVLIKLNILEETRRTAKFDVDLFNEGQAVGKAFIVSQFIPH